MKKLLTFLLIGLAVSLGQQAFSVVGWLSVKVLTERADLIFVGHVGEIASFKKQVPSKELGYVIMSTAETFPERIIKGEIDREPVIIEFVGGRVGEETYIFEDSPRFVTGEEVILFLKRVEGKTSYSIVGMSQGRYQIKEGMITRTQIKEGTITRTNVKVDQFLKEIQSIIKNK